MLYALDMLTWKDHGMDTSHSVEGTAVGYFYDHLRWSALASAALAYGDTYIGQECLLSPEEILHFARLL